MMRQKGIKLSVPQPCHEKWSEMSQSEKGRFCMSCQKEVVDFTTYSDEQILNYFSNASGKQCGRFHPMQLEKTIVSVRKVERPSTMKLFFGSLLVLLGLREGKAQETQKAELVTKQVVLEQTAQTSSKREIPGRLEGVVLDSTDGVPLIGVSVTLEGTTIGCSTDIDGKFWVKIPKEHSADSLIITISYLGYQSKRFNLITDTFPKKIMLKPDYDIILGGPMITVGVIEAEPLEKRMETLKVKTWLKSIGHW